MVPLNSHGLIPGGKWFLPNLPPSLPGAPFCPTSLTALLSKQMSLHLDPVCSFLHPQQDQSRCEYRCGLTFTSVSHCPVTITTENKGTLKTPISGLPNHTATELNLTYHCSTPEGDFLPSCSTLFAILLGNLIV